MRSFGDEIAVEGHPWPLDVVDIVWAPAGAKVAAIVKVRAAVLHPVCSRPRKPSSIA